MAKKKFKFKDNDEKFEKNNFSFDDSNSEDTQTGKKKKLKFKNPFTKLNKKGKIIAGVICLAVVLGVLFIGWSIFSVNDSKPVYGERCAGLVEIKEENLTKTEDYMMKKYPNDIESISLETACKEVHIDIVVKKNVKAADARDMAVKAAKALDKYCGYKVEKGETYSYLYGTYNDVSQYEVDVFMTSERGNPFPIYGTKHFGQNKFNWTSTNIVDKKTYRKVKKKK